MRLEAGKRLGPYEVLAPLGAGGMGEVWRARDTRLSREVAVKVLPAEAASDSSRLERFEREARSASSLNHPNIVTIYEIGQADSVSYIAMEMVEGKTLRELIAAGSLPIRKLLQIGTQLAEGLARAHEAGIVHRDLKPENVMVMKDGLVKILDFGLAKLRDAGPGTGGETNFPTETATAPGIVMGTVSYMSPEQAGGQLLDFRSDQFSFGSVLYEMATGKKAFARSTAVQTLAAIVQEEPAPVAAVGPGVPAPLRWIIERCLAKEPTERYASTSDLASELRTLRDHLSEAMVPTEASPARLRSSRVVAVLLGFAVLVAGGLLGRLVFRAAPAPPSFQRLTFRRGEVMAARFVPDARTVVYSFSAGGGPEDIYSLQAGSPEFRALELRGAQLLAVSSQGEMAVALGWQWGGPDLGGGTLARVSLAGGAPRQLLEGVIDADWAPDGKELAVLRFVEISGGRRIEFPAGKVLYETKGLPFPVEPRISRRADAIAFIELDRPNGIFSVHVMDRTGRRRKLSDGWKRARGIAWSAGGKEIWFTASRAGEGTALYAVTLSGRERLVARAPGGMRLQDIASDGRVLLTLESTRREMVGRLSGDTADRDLSWLDYSWPSDLSSDGKRLLFVEGGEGSGAAPSLWLRSVDGSAPVRLGEGGGGSGLSPDGKWVAAIRTRAGRPNELALVPTGAGEERRTEVASLSPTWAKLLPGGSRLLVEGLLADGTRGVKIVELSSGFSRPAAPEGWGLNAISPDGKWILCERKGEFTLYPLEGGVARPLPLADAQREELEKLGALDYVAGWADDDHTVFTSKTGIPGRFFRLDLRTFRAALWKEMTPPDVAGVRAVQPLFITPDGKFYVYTFRRVLSDLYLADGLR